MADFITEVLAAGLQELDMESPAQQQVGPTEFNQSNNVQLL